MKLGKVIGRVTLSVCSPALRGARWMITSPLTRENILEFSKEQETTPSPALSLIVYDDLGAGPEDIIGYVEGAEAAAPFETPTPIDAINTAIIDKVFYKPFES